MNSEKKYPYIGKSIYSDNLVLFIKKGCGALIDSSQSEHKGFVDWLDESTVIDLTKETLKKTWGIVESKEHAEFIVELADANSMGMYKRYRGGDGYFIVSGNEFIFTHHIPVVTKNYKQITIPLPPKGKPDFSDLPKHFDCICKKCGGKCCLGGCDKTWPSLGDRVTTYGQQGDVILPADKNGFYIINADGLYLAAKAVDITKPKSKEDLLIEELQAKLCENNYVDNYTLANDIVNGMIEGLSYVSK